MGSVTTDLVVLTGDYMTWPGDENAGAEVMRCLCSHLNPRLGCFGVFGNHDTLEYKKILENLPIEWLDNTARRLEHLPIELIGFRTDDARMPDTLSTLADMAHHNGQGNGAGHPTAPVNGHGDETLVRVLLSHYPTYLPTAADMGVDLMFCGHTHGGQCRLPGPRPILNSTDLPRRLTSGILRHRDTTCVISRGLGEHILPFRVFCPPQLPVYTLRRGPLIRQSNPWHLENVLPW